MIDILGSHGSANVDGGLLGCDAVLHAITNVLEERITLIFRVEYRLYPEGEGDKVFRNGGNFVQDKQCHNPEDHNT
jgi:hypothetical protein